MATIRAAAIRYRDIGFPLLRAKLRAFSTKDEHVTV
jgi:hypothetical protein